MGKVWRKEYGHEDYRCSYDGYRNGYDGSSLDKESGTDRMAKAVKARSLFWAGRCFKGVSKEWAKGREEGWKG